MKSTALKSIGRIPFFGHWLGLATLPLLIAVVNPNWLFNPNDRLQIVDPMIYQGLFRYLFDFASNPPTNSHYFVERLGWIVPGYIIYHIAPPLVANILLHIGLHMLSVIALYLTARLLFGANPAWLAAMCMGAYPWFLRSVGHDYLDGAGAAYFSVSLYFLALGATKRQLSWLFAAGSTIGLMLLTHLSWAVFTPGMALFFFHIARPAPLRQWLIRAGWLLGGLIFLAILAAIFSGVAFGRPVFLANSLNFANDLGTYRDILVSDAYQVYGKTLPTWHLLPVILAIASCLWLRRSKTYSGPVIRHLIAVIINWTAMYATFIILHHVGAVPYLIIYLYMSYAIPLTFLLLAGLISLAQPKLSDRTLWVVPLVLVAPFGFAVVYPALAEVQANAYWALSFGILVGMAFAVALWKQISYNWLAAAFGAFSFATGYGAGTYNPDRSAYSSFFESTQFVISKIESHYPDQKRFDQFRLWWHQGAYAKNAHAIAGIYQLLFRRSINDHPGVMLTVPDGPPLLEGDIVLFSDRSDAVQEAQQALGNQVRIEVLDSFDVPLGTNPAFYQGYVLRLHRHDRFDTPLLISGTNVGPILRDESGRDFAWTGPGEAVELQFNLESATSEPVTLSLCVLSDAQRGQSTVVANMDGHDFELTRVPPVSGCTFVYEGQVPVDTIRVGTPTIVNLDIPTVRAAELLGNGDTNQLGMAIRYVEFETQSARTLASTLPYDLEASGANISGLLKHESGVDYAWTGPDQTSTLEFKLKPPPIAEVMIDICALSSIVTPIDHIDGRLGDTPVVFDSVETSSDCASLYRAIVPTQSIDPTGTSSLTFTYPTGMADLAFHNGDTQQLGIAISYIRFQDPADFHVELELRGTNVLPLELHQSGVLFAWTGPESHIEADLHSGPLPEADLQLSICALSTILPPPLTLDVVANSEALTLKRLADTPDCPVLYGTIVAAGQLGERLQTLDFEWISAPADVAFRNGDQRPLGIAISYISLSSTSRP